MSSPKPYFEAFAQQIIDALEQGTAPWQKPWNGLGPVAPHNPVSGTVYRGINQLMLSMHPEAENDPRFITFKNAVDNGFKVKKGSKSMPVVYWQFYKDIPKYDDDGKPVRDENGKQEKVRVRRERPLPCYANVFHASQIEGMPELEVPEIAWDPNESGEAILANSGAEIHHNQRDRAFYSPQKDSIHLPPMGAFDTDKAYYATALHELAHWTGHGSRLNREYGPKGTPEYAREELRAEIASWMVGAETGIGHQPDQHAAYVKSWVKILKEDPYEIVRASQDAEQIKAVMLGFEKGQSIEQTLQGRPQESTTSLPPETEKNPPIKGGRKQSQPERDTPSRDVPERDVPQRAKPEYARQREFLDVPYGEKEEAKALGARWDRQARKWFAPKGTDLTTFSQWRQNKSRQHQEEFVKEQHDKAERPLSAENATKPVTVEQPKAEAVHQEQGREEGQHTSRQEHAEISHSQTSQPAMTMREKIMNKLRSLAPKEADEKVADSSHSMNERTESTSPAGMHPNQAVQPEKAQPQPQPPKHEAQAPERTPQVKPQKIYLTVPYKEKEEAKAAGARWDKREKLWFAPKDSDLAAFSKWMPKERQPDSSPRLSPEQEFAGAIAAAGLDLRGELPVMDGKLHRVPLLDAKAGKKDGAYMGALDGRPAGFIQNHVTGEKTNWKATGYALTVEEREALKVEGAQRREVREAALQEERQRAAKRSFARWKNAASWAPDTQPYLKEKGVKSFGVKVNERGELMIPARDTEGRIHSMQTVNKDGKFFERGGQKKGMFHLVDGDRKLEATTTICIAEGYATAASAHMATGVPVAAAFDAGNLEAVAKALHEKHPDKQIIILADDDHKHPNNPGLTKGQAAAKAVGGQCITPRLTEAEKAKGLTDFNDLHQSRGLKAVASNLGAALDRAKRQARSMSPEGLER